MPTTATVTPVGCLFTCRGQEVTCHSNTSCKPSSNEDPGAAAAPSAQHAVAMVGALQRPALELQHVGQSLNQL